MGHVCGFIMSHALLDFHDQLEIFEVSTISVYTVDGKPTVTAYCASAGWNI